MGMGMFSKENVTSSLPSLEYDATEGWDATFDDPGACLFAST